MTTTFISESEIEPTVTAEAHSNDWAIQVVFDAAKYLGDANVEDIRELAACGWGGDYPGDYVAEESESWEPRLSQLFDYIKWADTGFECHVNEVQAKTWLATNRPEVKL